MSAPPPPQGGYQTYDPQYQQYAGGQAPHGQRPVTPRRPSRRFNPRSPLGKAVVLVITAICASVWYLVKEDEPRNPGTTDDREVSAAVGDCMKEKGTDGGEKLEVVDCSDEAARYRVESTGDIKGDCRPGEVRYTETRRTVTLLTLCLSEAR
ncbi:MULTISPECIES: hypothetical protein [Streptomyces]|uniref:Subtilisin inhibitor-like n=1 Tax=Streptomyces lonegramiae TaxID=3075524 RepID=A0ABU2X777_9ACTN|nr:hypothetical protein [Streptomyces sp. DSM 41529]MDT0541289.1 hypothetical protein [Streptomyces sp. DSM 41529]